MNLGKTVLNSSMNCYFFCIKLKKEREKITIQKRNLLKHICNVKINNIHCQMGLPSPPLVWDTQVTGVYL